MYSLGHYPGRVPGEGTVHGEVYRIDNATLAELDALRTGGGGIRAPADPDAVRKCVDVRLPASGRRVNADCKW
ncbi:gamma-glutamylcyclotransferase [Enterobacter cloacae subsp. cloacae]|nr:gamma-glutamylcyclotransferase [Enterobacter cloacae subsp. cloacae]